MTAQEAYALALQHHQAGRLPEAETLYRQVLAAQADHTEAWHHLGVIAQQMSRHDLAVDMIGRALALNPENADALCNLGAAQASCGRLDDAIVSFRRALALQPNDAGTHNNLGNALKDRGQLEEAVAAYHRALVLLPDFCTALYNLGTTLKSLGRHEESIAAYRRVLQLQPNHAEAWNNLGNALAEEGFAEEAATAYQRATQFKPSYPEALNNLGNLLRDKGLLDEAIDTYRQVLELRANNPETYNNLGNALRGRGDLSEAMTAYRKAIALKPDDPALLSNLIVLMPMDPEGGERLIREEQTRWNHLHAAPRRPSWSAHRNDRDPDRRLKIGYVSPGFRSNSVAFFLLPLLEAHDHAAGEVYCYSSVQRQDPITDRFRKIADHWRDVRTWSEVQLAERIRDDGIDILVDLSMHTGGNQLPVFARKPAPVQVSWLACPGSSGMDAIDYRVTDRFIDPIGQEDDPLGGRLVRLPDAWCCYAPTEEFPPVVEPPATRKGFATFGSLNRFDKIHDRLLGTWTRLLSAVPDSRLLIVCPPGRASEKTLAFFVSEGIARERLDLVAPCPWAEFVRLFEGIDISLDSYPCNGMTTTCHTLWMGVPTVTWSGASAVSRAGSSLLHTIGLGDWVARSEDEYLDLAVRAAVNLPRLAALRSTMRARMEVSPLMDAGRFARNMEVAFRAMWRQRCATQPSSHP